VQGQPDLDAFAGGAISRSVALAKNARSALILAATVVKTMS